MSTTRPLFIAAVMLATVACEGNVFTVGSAQPDVRLDGAIVDDQVLVERTDVDAGSEAAPRLEAGDELALPDGGGDAVAIDTGLDVGKVDATPTCSSAQRTCGAICIPAGSCCTSADCGDGGLVCSGPGQICECPQAQRECRLPIDDAGATAVACVSASYCCTNADCTVTGERCLFPGLASCQCVSPPCQ